MKNTLNLMTTDRYRVLTILHKNMAVLANRTTMVPLTQAEIGQQARFGKHKMTEILQDLQDIGLVLCLTKGRYALTQRAIYLIDQMNEIEQNLPEISDTPYRIRTIDVDAGLGSTVQSA